MEWWAERTWNSRRSPGFVSVLTPDRCRNHLRRAIARSRLLLLRCVGVIVATEDEQQEDVEGEDHQQAKEPYNEVDAKPENRRGVNDVAPSPIAAKRIRRPPTPAPRKNAASLRPLLRDPRAHGNAR